MALWPGARDHEDIRILFAVEPPGAALLIAVLEGLEVVEEQYAEAVMAAADRLRLVRAGQVPEEGAHPRRPGAFLAGFAPGDAGRSSG